MEEWKKKKTNASDREVQCKGYLVDRLLRRRGLDPIKLAQNKTVCQ